MSWLDDSYFTDPEKRADLVADDRLAPVQIETAQKLNPVYQQKLGKDWRGADICAYPVDSVEFAEAIREWQRCNTGWEPDGILGPKTNAAIAGDCFEAPPGKDYFLIDNVYVTSEGLRVVTPGEPGALVFQKEFYSSGGSWDLFVVHWDGCVSSHSCFDTLVARGLSVPFEIDDDGTIFECLNPARQTGWHAGSVNRRALGVEIANPVLPERQKYCTPARPLTTMKVRGDTHPILGFYEVQLRALVGLLDFCCGFYNIPRQLPAYKGQLGALPPDAEDWQKVANSYIRGPGEKWNVKGFKGIVGHYHQDNNKCDPGMDVWNYVLANLPDCTVVEVI